MDFDGERSAPAAVSVVGGDRAGAVGAGGGRPTPPANLTSSVYSSSAAEVFWDRNGQQGLTYEVSVDGGQVVTTDGTSAFLSGLDGARGRGVDVVAIDANGQRSGAANVTLGGGGNPNPPSGNGDAPAAPSNLRGERYSSSAGEVFWDRVPGTRLEYEVSIESEVVTTTTGTSYFIGNRPEIEGTRVEVVTIGPNGARSNASRIVLASGSNGLPDPFPDPNTNAPPAPANARIDVYSGTAAELFFDRASSSANVVETEISRDGTVIGSTSGTSFFDPDRTPGRDYVYELVAVNGSGARSSASTVGETMMPPQSDDLPADAAARLDTVFALANGDAFAPLLAFLDRIDPIEASRNGTPISSAPDPEFLPQAGPREVFACPDGGRFAVTVGTEGSSNIYRTSAESCTIGDAIVNGTFVQQSSRNGVLDPASSSTEIEDYVLAGPRTGVVTTIDSGRIIETEPQANRGGAFVPTFWEADGLSVTGGGEDYAVSSLSVRSSETSSLSGGESDGLRVTAEGLSSALYDEASVETVATLLRDGPEGRYTIGSLRIVDGDRAETLDVDAGDSAAFQFTVEGSGATTSYTVPFSDRFDFERIDSDAVEFGEVPNGARALLDRPWQLSRYTAPDGTLRDVLPSAVFQFRLEPGSSRADAFDLCVDQNGSYELGDGFVVIRLDGPTDGLACSPDDPGAERQVNEARTILDGDRDGSGTIGVPLTYAVEGDTLTLSAADDRQLVFVEVDELEQQQ